MIISIIVTINIITVTDPHLSACLHVVFSAEWNLFKKLV